MRLERFGVLPLPVDRRVYQPWGNGVYPHPDRAEVAGNGQGHAHNPALGGRVGRLAYLAIEGGGGRHVDDSATAAVCVHRLCLGHCGGGATQYVEGADKVNLDDKTELVQVQWHIAAVDGPPGSTQAGGVHAGPQGAQLAGGRDGRIGILGFGNIAFDEYAAYLPGDLFPALFIEIGDNHF